MKYTQKCKDKSIYAENRRKKFANLSKIDQLTRFGYWNMEDNSLFDFCYLYKKNNVYYFGGLIALEILVLTIKKLKLYVRYV